jgi:RecB family exonuclease
VRAIEQCPARWFLERQVQATSQAETVMVFGNAIHAIAQGLQTKEIPLDMAAIDQKLDRLWPGMGYEAPWESQQMRTEAHAVSSRLFAWLVQQGEVESIAEAGLKLKTSVNTTNLDGSPRVIQLSVNGRADRIEFQADGVVVYDFKTGRNPMDKKDLPTDIQLALYSYLVKSGNYEDGASQKSLAPETHVKGAALVQLRSSPKDQKDLPIVQFVNAGDHDQDSEVSLEERLASAASIILDETYEARYEAQRCRTCAVRIMCPAVPEGRPVL